MNEPMTVYRILATRDDGVEQSYPVDYQTLTDAHAQAQKILASPSIASVEVVTREIHLSPLRAVMLNDQFTFRVIEADEPVYGVGPLEAVSRVMDWHDQLKHAFFNNPDEWWSAKRRRLT